MIKLVKTLLDSKVLLESNSTSGTDGTSAKSRSKKSREGGSSTSGASGTSGTSAKSRSKKSDRNKPTTQPQPTKPPTDVVDPNSSEHHLQALNNVQRFERMGKVVDCEDTFPFPLKKGDKYCRSKKIGDFNKCFFGHNLENIAGEDLFDYLDNLGFTIENGVKQTSYDQIMEMCKLNENKKFIKKIIKENTIKILSEYLNK